MLKSGMFNMLLTKTQIFIVLTAALLCPQLCLAQQTTSLDAKRIEIEDKLQTKVDRALSKMMDPKDFIAIVSVELGEEKIIFEGDKKKTVRLLPGVPERKEVGKKEDVVTEEALYKYFITNIFATLTIDKSIPEERVAEIQELVVKLLKLKFPRGDTIEINRTDMFVRKIPSEEPPGGEKGPVWVRLLLERKDIVWVISAVIGILIITVFLFGPLRRFFAQLVTILPGLKTRSVEERSGGGVMQLTGGGQGGGGGGFGGGGGGGESTVTFKSGQAGQKAPFSFVNRNNLNNLFLLVKDKSPEQIAAVLHYLDSELASVMLAKLDPKIRAQILITIPRERQFSPEEVDSLDAEIRQNINYLIGGMDMLIGIYESSDRETQEQMMQMLSDHRPDVVEKIRQRTVSFDDLFRLDKPSLRMVLREIPLRSLAISLKTSSEELRNKILDILPEGMSEILKEEMEFSQTVSSTRIDEEQRKIIQLVRRLNDEGRIVLKPTAESRVEIPPSAPAPAAAPEKAAVRKIGMQYKQDTASGKTEAIKSPASSTKPETSAIARLLADRKLRMKKKK
jgi:hypothetical protein